ncbi:hypothetical protein BJ973_003055 [Actinoplanes tereljensis]|uniref:DUF3558 domain-containing protein n=1 Tax=Paractinoplanes tereljensis TaxID=571912 RepID=A0A919NXJ9_9ACTN|nr:hypothetical protein [Actinoplanes tereljensis]GIF25781.1 hypothetical protein Ate02nite_85110 [Actinoplanes tereljensis]
MKPRRSVPFLVAAVAATSLSGFGLLTSMTTSAAAAATAEATGGFTSVTKRRLPDPCTLLSRPEVVDLTGRDITQIDEDGARPGASTRYCQWQQDGGQLALFLTRTTRSGFASQIGPDAEPVGGVGDDAFLLAGHLYVLHGTVQIDVYSYGDDDEQNVAVEQEVATVVMSKL